MNGIRRKIRRAMMIITVCSIVLVSAVFCNAFAGIFRSVLSRDEQMEETIAKLSEEAMDTQIRSALTKSATDIAMIADAFMEKAIEKIRIIADAAAMAYEGADTYPGREIPLPDPAKDGTYSVQLLFTRDAEEAAESTRREILLLGNVQDVLLSVCESSDSINSACIATESGIMIWADEISGKKLDEEGGYYRYDPDRPWYTGAKESGDVYFTPLTRDGLTGKSGVICSTPIFCHQEFRGAVCATIYLDTFDDMLQEKTIDPAEDKCFLDQNGRVLFSTRETGEMVAETDNQDLRKSRNKTLAVAVAEALSGTAGVTAALVDGEAYHLFFAPVKSTGWSYLILLPTGKVTQLTDQLLGSIQEIKTRTEGEVDGILTRNILILIGLVVLATLLVLWGAMRLSHRIADPINRLTEKVSAVQGDALDFVWEENTGDETQLLAVSFRDLTERIKQYIREVQEVTAKEERISAELKVAARIQADMLPRKFPAFPERDEFDIYASMMPAKEVGGDFYDFFLNDPDHLAVVIADVSEKGVPAALFMVGAKTLIRNQAQTCRSPGKILAEVNRKLCEGNDEGMFVTVWLGIMEISTGRIVAANAGHEYPAVRRKSGAYELLQDEHEMMLGLMEDVVYPEYEIHLDPGEALFLYTDGVAEATDDQREFFGTDRMLEALNREPMAGPERLVGNVKAAVDAFAGQAPQFDDLTMLALMRKKGN